jgi:hypothetical protein
VSVGSGHAHPLYEVERELKARCAEEWRDLPREELEDRIADVRQERLLPVPI